MECGVNRHNQCWWLKLVSIQKCQRQPRLMLGIECCICLYCSGFSVGFSGEFMWCRNMGVFKRLHLYNAFKQRAFHLVFHWHTAIRSRLGFSILLKDTLTRGQVEQQNTATWYCIAWGLFSMLTTDNIQHISLTGSALWTIPVWR